MLFKISSLPLLSIDLNCIFPSSFQSRSGRQPFPELPRQLLKQYPDLENTVVEHDNLGGTGVKGEFEIAPLKKGSSRHEETVECEGSWMK